MIDQLLSVTEQFDRIFFKTWGHFVSVDVVILGNDCLQFFICDYCVVFMIR